jgi:hypothetical protein
MKKLKYIIVIFLLFSSHIFAVTTIPSRYLNISVDSTFVVWNPESQKVYIGAFVSGLPQITTSTGPANNQIPKAIYMSTDYPNCNYFLSILLAAREAGTKISVYSNNSLTWLSAVTQYSYPNEIFALCFWGLEGH